MSTNLSGLNELFTKLVKYFKEIIELKRKLIFAIIFDQLQFVLFNFFPCFIQLVYFGVKILKRTTKTIIKSSKLKTKTKYINTENLSEN